MMESLFQYIFELTGVASYYQWCASPVTEPRDDDCASRTSSASSQISPPVSESSYEGSDTNAFAGQQSPGDHINALRTRTDVEELLKRSLQSVSRDLNSTADRILLELLQNADDNKYDDNHPTLALEYTANQQLEYHCNERGFTREDVDAICGVGQSTKLRSATTTGEKGIGFKSVFGVASTAWIVSGNYRFKLHSDNMVRPDELRDRFPNGEIAVDGGTHMYFEIEEKEAQDMRAAVEQFDPTNILFLNNLERINTKVDGKPTQQLLRKRISISDKIHHITIVQDGRTVLSYKQFNFSVKPTVMRSCGRDIENSHIKLAFPVTADFKWMLPRDEKVYACLPIAEFGFRFAIHADFVMTANREGIHGNSKWNQQLRDAIPEKFAEAVELLNKCDSNLCYSWPLLLTTPPKPGEFFRTTPDEIMEALKARPVLKTETGDIIAPTDPTLVWFPAKWRLGPNKELPIPKKGVGVTYLSHMYPTDCIEVIIRLGVKEISQYSFSKEFKNFVDNERNLERQSEDWHVRIAEMLNKDHKLRFYLHDIRIIPVEGGEDSWISSDQVKENLLIATENDSIDLLPQKIGILSIPQAASRNKHRKQLFETYGARSMSELTHTIAKKIREAHSTSNPTSREFYEWTTKDLVSHVSFLYRNKTEIRLPDDLWVATDSDGLQRASTTFLKPLDYGRVPILHRDYVKGLSKQGGDSLLAWMSKTFKMPKSPRLAVKDETGFTLSPEMKSIAEKCDSIIFLELLRSHWTNCSHMLTKGMEGFQKELWDQIVSIKIHCQDERLHPLGRTLLQPGRSGILERRVPLPLLPIPQNDYLGWKFLAKLGVKLRPDADDWLQCLRHMRERMVDTPDEALEQASLIYLELEDACRSDEDKLKVKPMLRNRFQKEDLVFIPADSSSESLQKYTWAYANQCIWSKPENFNLRHSYCLCNFQPYARNENFFRDVINIPKKWNFERLLQEAKQLVNLDLNACRTEKTWRYIVELILLLSQEILSDNEWDRVSAKERNALKNCIMLPILSPDSELCFNKLVAANDKEEWFIADREILHSIFEKKAPLLAMSTQETRDCARLLSLLDLRNRWLSDIAVALPPEKPIEDDACAAIWMGKAQYIDRLWHEPLRRRPTHRVRLRSVEIKAFCLEALEIEWAVESNKGNYRSTTSNREAVVSLRDGVLSIYVQKDSHQLPGTLMELAGDICDICRIPNHRRLLVQYVIAEDDKQKIEAKLKNEKVPELSKEELAFFPATYQSLAKFKKAQEQPRNSSQAEEEKSDDCRDPMTIGSGVSVGDPLRPSDESKSWRPVEEKKWKKRTFMQEQEPKEHQTKLDATMKRGIEALEQSIPNESLRQQPREKLERLTVSRRLQESTIEELLLQAPLPVTKNAQETPNANTLLCALQEAKNVHDKSSDHSKSQPSATMDNSEHMASVWKYPRISSNPDFESIISQYRSTLPEKEGQQRPDATYEEKPAQRKRRLIQQFSGTLEASKLFRQSAQTNTFYVIRRDELPLVDPGDGEDSETRVLESRLRIPKDQSVERALYALLPTPSGSHDKEADFLGQVWVSQLFSNHLGLAYRHGDHWKSPLRMRLDPTIRWAPENKPYYQVPFEIHDEIGCRAMSRFLIANSFNMAETWQQQPPAYYIDVATTSGACSTLVEMATSRFAQAREYHIRHGEKSPKHVFIFVRIFHVNATDSAQSPKAAFYINPWQMYTDGRIDVFPNQEKYSVSFNSDPTFFVDHVERHTYKWRELQDDTTIRLLRLEKGSWEDELKGSFQVWDLISRDSKSLEYMAISYAWGSSLKQFSLHITDSNDGSPILLQTSLYLALRRLRQEDRSVLVWADAVCIDQSNNSEKAKQILLLPQIFQSAQEVLAWLGEEEDNSSEAMGFLNSLGGWVLEYSGRTRGLDDSRTSTRSKPDLPQVGDAMWVAVGHLLKRSWFSRMWIVQEAVLAAKLVMRCGPETMPWEVLHAATALCFMNGLWDPKIECPIADQRTQKNILQLGDLRAKSSKDGQFRSCDCVFNLLQLFHQKDVTKPRDRLFALLGMAEDGTEPSLRPSYEDSDEDVLVRYGVVFVKQGHGLNLLYQARMAGRVEGLPSWMPDFTAAIYPRTITAWGGRRSEVRPEKASEEFRASGNVSDLRDVQVDGKVLPLQGWVVDEIVDVGEYTSNTDDVILFIEEIFSYVNHVYRSISPREREEILCRLPIGGTYKSATSSWDPEDQSREPRRKRATRMDAYRNMLQYLDFRRNRSSEDEEMAIQEAGQADYTVSYSGLIRRRMWPYYQTVLEFADSFQPASAVVCETKEGRVGLVPQTARAAVEKEPGDKIVIFMGAKVPYIIRKSGTTPEIYQAVGECYIDGVMHGELFRDGKQRSSLRLQEFRLE